MLRITKHLATVAALSVWVPLTVHAANGLEANDFAQAMADAVARGNAGSATFASASKDGDRILISDFSVTPDDGAVVTFSEIVVEGPSEGSNGVYLADAVAFIGGTVKGEINGTIQSAAANKLVILPEAIVSANDLPQSLLYDTGTASGISIKPEDQDTPLTVEAVTINLSDVVDYVPQKSDGEIRAVSIPGAYFEDGQPVSLDALGYDNLVLDMAWNGGRDAQTKMLSVEEFTLSMRDGGSLAISGEIGNVPTSGSVDSEQAMEVLAGLSLQSLSLTYMDNSLASRILDSAAQMQGVDRDQYVNQLAAALPFFLAALRNPDFQTKVADAIGAFLKNPQSLKIELKPEAPVSGAEIMGLVGTAPQALPDRLNASITANSN